MITEILLIILLIIGIFGVIFGLLTGHKMSEDNKNMNEYYKSKFRVNKK